uniref:CoB--CoM heterodisulfide reductase subunit B n=1 Tax=candidate division WOR-3 bacterium TaxID=2052148 RepID=A0A7C4UHN2_UNCW3
MRYGLFLGCTVPVRAQNYELSGRKVAERLGIELVDIPEFRCCGYPLKAVDSFTQLLLSSYNLAIAEHKGIDKITTFCNACSVTMIEANEEIKHNDEIRKKVNEELKKQHLSYNGNITVKHFARVLYEDYGIEKIKEKIVKELKGFRFASHYGCHFIRPSKVYSEFDDPQFPVSLDRLVQLTGAESIDYPEKQLCCGGGILGIKEDTALALSNKKLSYLKERNIDGLISICPFCSVMYESNQKKIEKTFNKEYNIPVVYYTQILGLALGFSPDEIGLKMNRIKPERLLTSI